MGGEGRVDGGLGANADGGFVGPQAGDVAGGVAPAAEDEERQVQGLGEGDAGAVGFDVEVEAAETVPAEGIGAALDDDCRGAVGVVAGLDDVSKKRGVGFVVDAVVEGYVEGMVCSGVEVAFGPGFVETAGSGEKFNSIVFVEGEGHDAVGAVEGLFDAVAVVDVDVDVEHTRVVEEEVPDREDYVVDVAESRCGFLFRVVQAAGPVDGDVGASGGECAGAVEG